MSKQKTTRSAFFGVAVALLCLFSAGAEATSTVSLVSLNLWGIFSKYNRRLEATVVGLEKLQPDIILVQEVSKGLMIGRWKNSSKAIAEALGYHYEYRQGVGIKEVAEGGLAILSKYPIHSVETRTMAHATVFDRRAVMRAVVETPSGPVVVYNTHLRHGFNVRRWIRAEQVLDILEFMGTQTQPFPALLAGDFNDDPEHAVFHLMEKAGLNDTFADNPLPTFSPENTNVSKKLHGILGKGLRIDFVFQLGDSLQLEKAERIFDEASSSGVFPSDHFGLFAEFQRKDLVDRDILHKLRSAGLLARSLKAEIAGKKEALRSRILEDCPLDAQDRCLFLEQDLDRALQHELPLWVEESLARP